MKNKKIKSSKEGNHDDCEDCRREKKQNEALLSIYAKLQAVDSRSKTMRNSVTQHLNQCSNTRSKFGEFSIKFSSIPKQNKTTMELQRMGHELAKEMVEDTLKGSIRKQNQRLKTILKRMHISKKNSLKDKQDFEKQQRMSVSAIGNYPMKNSSFSENNSFFDNNSRECWSDKQYKKPSIRYCGQSIMEQNQQNDTKTTGFLSTKNRKTFNQTDKIKELNLWLFDCKANKNLQESLYQQNISVAQKTTSRLQEKRPVLPAIPSVHRRK